MKTKSKDNLVWIDLEMTGLEVETDRIIEIAVVMTDSELNILAEGPVIAITQPDHVIDGMNEWCVKTHGETGLTERVRKSVISEVEAEKQALDFIKEYVPEGASPLCENSIWQDRKFLAKYMPTLEAYFHYRLLDVSTLKILASAWYPEVYKGVKKKGVHLALDDIKDSIAELQYYREYMLK